MLHALGPYNYGVIVLYVYSIGQLHTNGILVVVCSAEATSIEPYGNMHVANVQPNMITFTAFGCGENQVYWIQF